MSNKIEDWLIICVWRALLGEIYPSLRAIAISLHAEKTLLIRAYLDREPIDADTENLEIIATNITASVGADRIANIELECIYSDEPVGKLDSLDGIIYARREYNI